MIDLNNVGTENDDTRDDWLRWDDVVIALALVFVIFGCVVGWL